MKKLSLVLLLSLISLYVYAEKQEDIDEYMKLTRTDLRAEKVQIITDAMKFSPDEAAAFWPVYNKYQAELNVIGDQLLALIKEYAENYSTLDDARAMDLTKQTLGLRMQRTGLMQKYVGEFAKVLPGKRVARFVQIESQINRLIDIQVASGIPLAPQK